MTKDEYWKKNLYREVAIMKKLRHPNIIQVPFLRCLCLCSSDPWSAISCSLYSSSQGFQLLEIFETDNFICFVTELASCDLLTHLCSVGTSSERESRKFARQLISALEHMHSKGIVHRYARPSQCHVVRHTYAGISKPRTSC